MLLIDVDATNRLNARVKVFQAREKVDDHGVPTGGNIKSQLELEHQEGLSYWTLPSPCCILIEVSTGRKTGIRQEVEITKHVENILTLVPPDRH